MQPYGFLVRTMAFTAHKPSFVATCNGPSSWIQGLLAKVQAYAAPIKSKVAQVYAEHGFSLDSTATTAGTTAGDVWQALGAQKPTLTDPTPEVANLALAAGTADDTCTITLTTKKLGKDFAGDTETITFTGDFTVNPVKWTAAPSAGITGNAEALIKEWK